MNAFERALIRRLDTVALPKITPGVVIDVHGHGRRLGLVRAGSTYDFYDLASLTKILFTTSRSIMHFSEFPGELTEPIQSHLPWWRYRTTTPAALLSHRAGLEWWIPAYRRMRGPLDPGKRWPQMLKILKDVRARKRPGAIYSDIDLWMTGAYLEARLESTLEEMWAQVADRLKVGELRFHPRNKPAHAIKRYAPTEDCAWRGRVLRGEVHDENAWALGGIAPHAGLFGEVEAVSDWGLQLRQAVLGNRTGFGNPATVRHFTGRRMPRLMGDWGLGFMKPSLPRSSCGKYFSRRSFGHTGFTGTSLWFDPVKDLLVVILSNRVHPTRANTEFQQLRPRIHDWICEILRH